MMDEVSIGVREATRSIVAAQSRSQPQPVALPLKKSNVLVIACDTSEFSRHALRWTMKHLYRDGDAVHIVNVWSPQPHLFSNPAGAELAVAHTEGTSTMFEQLFDDIEAELGAVDYRAHITSGSPGPALLEAARGIGADYIVAGTRSLGALEALFKGSVSQYLVKHSTIPVLVVPFWGATIEYTLPAAAAAHVDALSHD